MISDIEYSQVRGGIVFLSFGVVFDAILFAVGVIWCREMFGRWRSDLAEFRSTRDSSVRTVSVLLWSVTAIIVVSLVNFAVGLLKAIGAL